MANAGNKFDADIGLSPPRFSRYRRPPASFSASGMHRSFQVIKGPSTAPMPSDDQARPHAKTAIERQIDATDGQVDRLVYELYGLTEGEIKIAEGKPGNN